MQSQQAATLQRAKKLKIVLLLTSLYFVIRLAGGIWVGSLALIADVGHMLTDVAGLLLSLFAIGFTRMPATPQITYGFYRMEILATLTNSVVLISTSFYIIYEAYQRILHPEAV